MLAAIPTKAVVISQGLGTRVASTYHVLVVFHSTLASKLSFLRLHKREEERGQEGSRSRREEERRSRRERESRAIKYTEEKYKRMNHQETQPELSKDQERRRESESEAATA